MFRSLPLILLAAISAGCIHVDPIEIHATVDVNVKVDREVAGLLTDIYGDAKPAPKTSTPSEK